MPEDLSRAVAAEIRRLMDAPKVSGYALAKATGILSTQTVMRKLKAAGVVRDKVKSRDGSIRPATAQSAASPRPRIRRTDRVIELLAGAGKQGLSVRDVAQSLCWSQHIAAATLCRLAAACAPSRIAAGQRFC